MPHSQLPPESNKVVRILFRDIGKGIADLRKALGVTPPAAAAKAPSQQSKHVRLTGKQKPPEHLEQVAPPAPVAEPPKPRRRIVGKQKA